MIKQAKLQFTAGDKSADAGQTEIKTIASRELFASILKAFWKEGA